jgi:hypothetical protein
VNDILIDANIIFGLYKEDILEIPLEVINLTESPKLFFENIDRQRDIIYLDDCGEHDGQIINEWKRLIPRNGKEWFDAWVIKLFQLSRIKKVKVDVGCSYRLMQSLVANGFPQAGGDKWYVRTAKCVALNKNGLPDPFLVTIISEDIDFFDPTKKDTCSGEARKQVLQTSNGEIPKLLAGHKINICCISNY